MDLATIVPLAFEFPFVRPEAESRSASYPVPSGELSSIKRISAVVRRLTGAWDEKKITDKLDAREFRLIVLETNVFEVVSVPAVFPRILSGTCAATTEFSALKMGIFFMYRRWESNPQPRKGTRF